MHTNPDSGHNCYATSIETPRQRTFGVLFGGQGENRTDAACVSLFIHLFIYPFIFDMDSARNPVSPELFLRLLGFESDFRAQTPTTLPKGYVLKKPVANVYRKKLRFSVVVKFKRQSPTGIARL